VLIDKITTLLHRSSSCLYTRTLKISLLCYENHFHKVGSSKTIFTPLKLYFSRLRSHKYKYLRENSFQLLKTYNSIP